MILLPLLFSSPQSLLSQELNWTSFEELAELQRKEARPLMVFIHADWCKFCLMQENNTFSDKEIADYLNENYYVLKLNGESKEAIRFLGREYNFTSSGAGTGQHQLAELLGKVEGSLTYPTTVMLSPEFQLKGREVGFLNSDAFIALLRRTFPSASGG
ncbi:MAG: thioredoxin family protein [Bacteroidota bacterium]